MIEPLERTEPSKTSSANQELTLLELVIALARRKKLLLTAPVVAAALSAAVTFVLPNVYHATTRLLPPQQSQSGAAALLAQIGGVAGMAAGAAGLKSPNDLYVGMLKSRTVADQLVSQFDLKKVYGVESNEKARKILDDNTVILSGKDGLITIDVDDENQKLVALIANGYVDQLLKLTRVLAVTESSQRRLFYEQQLEAAKNKLANAEVQLRGSIDTHGFVSVDAESRVMLETVGRLRAQVSAKEIELNSMKAFVTESNPDYHRVQEELNSLRNELGRLENGRQGGNTTDQTEKSPNGLQNIKLLRDVKYYEMLYELLAKQYELARLDEAKDASVIQVLDKAIDPERKAKPKRAVIIALAYIVSLIATTGWIMFGEIKRRALRSPVNAAQYEELKAAFWSFKTSGKN